MASRKKYPHEITQEERDEFEAALRKWQKILNLNDWRVELVPEPATAGASADVAIFYEHRLAKVALAKNARARMTPTEIESFALHELLHVRLADLIHTAQEKADEKALEAAEHTLIVLFDKLLRK